MSRLRQVIPDVDRALRVRTILVRHLTGGDVSPLEIGKLLDHLLEDLTPHLNRAPLDPHEFELSERERQVIEALAEGLTNVEIGERLGISGLTVKSHVSRLCARMGARSRAHAVAIAYQEGVLR